MQKIIITTIAVILFIALGVQTYMFYKLHQQVNQLTASRLGNSMQIPSMKFDDEFMDNDAWDPYQEMLRMQNEMSELFGKSMSRFHLNSKSSLTKMPAFNLKEQKDRYIATLDVPGGNPSSLDVKLDGQQLSISIKTEHTTVQDKGGKNQYRRQERFSGTYQRSMTLPGPVKESAMTSDYKNGVLTIIIPKAS